jgi:hypothetical protein
MNTLRKAMQDYLILRRALGFKLHDAGVALQDFVSFLERKRRSHITSRLALQWAQRPTTVQPAHWARRLTFVRGFARYRSATDPRTEIPPLDLLPFRPKRARPYLYTEHEVLLLLKASLNLSPTDAIGNDASDRGGAKVFKRDVAPFWPPSVELSHISSLISAVAWLPCFALFAPSWPPSELGAHCLRR